MNNLSSNHGGRPMSDSPFVGNVLKILLYALIILALQVFTFCFRFPPFDRSPIWIPGSFILAVALSTPIRQWWIILVATTIAGISSYWNDSVFGLIRALIAIPVIFLSLLVAVPAIHAWGRRPLFQSTRSLIAFFPFAVLFIPMVCIGLIYWIAGFFSRGNEFSIWPTQVAFSVSHSIGYLLGTPIFYLGLRDWRRWVEGMDLRGIFEFAALFAVLGLVNHLIFNSSGLGSPLESVGLYLPMLPLILVAVRFGVAGISCCLILFAFQAAWGAIQGRGPFLSANPAENVLHLQIYLVIFSFPLLILGAAFEERGLALQNLEIECGERQAAEDRFRTLVEIAPIAIVMVDSAERIRMVNACAEKTFGRDRSELMGQTVSILFPPETEPGTERVQSIFGELSLAGKTLNTIGRRSGRAEFPIDLTTSQVTNSEGQFELLAIVDTSERKRAELFREELTQAARLVTLGSLATSIAHEINQPLGAILNNCESAEILLQEEQPPLEILRNIMADIRRDNLRASEVIKSMRAFLRHERAEMKPINIAEVITQVVDFVRPEAHNRHVVVRAELPAKLPQIQGDRVHLQQVLLNLLVNGLEAMRGCQGKLELLIRAHSSGDHIEIEVLDNGIGLESEQLSRLFERIHSTKENGLGMGLVISKSLIESHQGQIGASNLPSGGARFWIRLPVCNQSQLGFQPSDGTLESKRS